MRKNILLHFFNLHAQEIVGMNIHSYRMSPSIRHFLSMALRAGILLSERAVVMPPGFFLESSAAFDVIARSSAFLDAGLIELPMRETNLADLIEKKRSEYQSVSHAFAGLFDDVRLEIFANTNPFFVQRRTRIGETATLHWQSGPDEDPNWAQLLNKLSPNGVEHVRSAPIFLREEGVALTWPALLPHLNSEAMASETLVRVALQQNYFDLYLTEFELAFLCDLPHNMDVFYPKGMKRYYSYRTLVNLLQSLNMTWVWSLPPLAFIHFDMSPGWTAFADALVQLIAKGLADRNIASAFAASAHKYRLGDQGRAMQDAHGDNIAALQSTLIEVCEILRLISEDISLSNNLTIRTSSNAQNVAQVNEFAPHKNENTISANFLGRKKSPMRRVLLATANEREATAAIELFKSAVEGGKLTLDVSLDRTVPVARGTLITAQNSRITIEIAVARETGGANAVLMFDRYIRTYRPDAAFFVGCAGLVDEKIKSDPMSNSHQAFQDLVLIAKRAFDGEKRRVETDRVVYDQDSYHGNGPLIERLRIMNASGAFLPIKLITNRDFISSATFHASRISLERQAIVSDFPEDAIVMEQEAFAVYQHVSFLQEEDLNIATLVIKGISDLGDPTAQENKVESQMRATRNASQVVLTYLMAQ